MRSDEEVKAEVESLWEAVFGERPAAQASPSTMLDVLVAGLPLPGYDTITRFGVQPPRDPRPGVARHAN